MKKTILIITAIMLTFTSCKEKPASDAADAVLDVIATRTSVRSFTDREVSDEIVEKLLRAGMAAPSGMNMQPWEFIVIKDRAVLDDLADKLPYAKMLYEAPLAFVVCAQTRTAMSNGRVWENPYWVYDSSAAIENILLAAHALGLGAVWTDGMNDKAPIVKKALGIPESVATLGVIPIGYPAENPAPKDKWRPEKIHFNKW